MFANDIIEENYFCQLHGQVIFIAKKIKKITMPEIIFKQTY